MMNATLTHQHLPYRSEAVGLCGWATAVHAAVTHVGGPNIYVCRRLRSISLNDGAASAETGPWQELLPPVVTPVKTLLGEPADALNSSQQRRAKWKTCVMAAAHAGIFLGSLPEDKAGFTTHSKWSAKQCQMITVKSLYIYLHLAMSTAQGFEVSLGSPGDLLLASASIKTSAAGFTRGFQS